MEKGDLTNPDKTIRLNKYIAHCGISSRRKAEEFIKAGKIKVNGKIIREVGHRIIPTDKVEYKGMVIKLVEDLIYILMNKPKNTITTTSDEKGRRTVLELIDRKERANRLYPVGRLDRNTTGLLLFTNDGDLAKKLTHPSHKVKKMYHVILNRRVGSEDLEKIRGGLVLEDGPVNVNEINFVEGADGKEVMVSIHLGKNRIVRRIFEHLGYEVERLDRVYFAGLTKKGLGRGKYRHLRKDEVVMLKHFS